MAELMHPPGKLERSFRALAYLVTTTIGLSVMLGPPVMETLLGETLALVWAAFILSAAPCVWAALAARYRVEYILLPLFTTALAVSVVSLWVHYSNGDFSFTLQRALVASGLVFMFSARWFSLHKVVSTKGAGQTWMGQFLKRSK